MLLHIALIFGQLMLFAHLAASVLISSGLPRVVLPAHLPAVQTSIIAYVVSQDINRWTAVQEQLRACNLSTIRVQPASLEQARAHLASITGPDWDPTNISQRALRLTSMILTQMHVAELISQNPDIPPDGFGLVFEDDAALHEHVAPHLVAPLATAAHEASKWLGFFYLGICKPWCSPAVDATALGGVQFSRCIGLCGHAYGLSKIAAPDFWAVVRSKGAARCWEYDYSCDVTELIAADVLLGNTFQSLPMHRWPVVVGANLTNHDVGEGGGDRNSGTGLFYQNDKRFPSTMWTSP